MKLFLSFPARIVSGAGRGRTIGSPTINLELKDVPKDLKEGVFACHAFINTVRFPAALFYGPRPVFQDSRACEVFLIDAVPSVIPQTLTITIIGFLRPVRDFPSIQKLQEQIRRDTEEARAMLATYDAPETEKTDS